jgi:hypothetical protein
MPKWVTTEQVMRPAPSYTYHYRCDNCGYESERHEEFNEVILQLDPEECVSFAFRRIYCAQPACAAKWDRLCEIIAASPDDYSKSDFEDG